MAGQLLNGLDVVERHDPAVGRRWGWSDLDHGSGVVVDDLDLRTRIRIPVLLSQQLENAHTSIGLPGDEVLDVDVTKCLRAIVLSSMKEGAKFLPDLARLGSISELDVVGDL